MTPLRISHQIAWMNCQKFLHHVWQNFGILKNNKSLYFLDNLKLADVVLVFKKEDNNLAKKYIPVSVLHIVSIIFERQIQKQTISYVDKFLSNF